MITTHILDTSCGKPATQVKVKLEWETRDNNWKILSEALSDSDGRVKNFPEVKNIATGIYRLTFFTSDYFKSRHTDCFYPYICLTFKVSESEHYHVPLLLNPFGYSTYRGC